MKKKTNYYWKGNRNQNKIKINIRRNKKEEGEDRRLPTVETRCCCPIWIPGTKSCVLQDESLVGIGNKGKKPILAHRRSLDIKSLFILCWDKFSGIQFVSFPIFGLLWDSLGLQISYLMSRCPLTDRSSSLLHFSWWICNFNFIFLYH